VLVVLGLIVVMGPWWARNARVLHRFVPTALWAGASLYDGLNPEADGSSNMRFLESPEFVALDEPTQDAVLRDRAFAFAKDHPGRAAYLALVKAGRFWSPWPNEPRLRSRWWVVAAGVLITLPLYALLILGLWDRRADLRVLTLLAGPLLYFAFLHMVFVGSLRYRVPAIVPAYGLMAIGARCWFRGTQPD
jgi:hypothetical protein